MHQVERKIERERETKGQYLKNTMHFPTPPYHRREKTETKEKERR
jgi:hypothetical protein